MATTTPAVGQTISWSFNNVAISGDSFDVVDTQDENDCSSFTSGGATEIARGFYQTTFTASGVWNLAANPQTAGLIIGNSGRIVVRVNNVVVKIIPIAIISEFSTSGKIRDVTRYNVVAKSDWVVGNFAGGNN